MPHNSLLRHLLSKLRMAFNRNRRILMLGPSKHNVTRTKLVNYFQGLKTFFKVKKVQYSHLASQEF